MYRNGVFTNLAWDNVKNSHRYQWNMLKFYFGYSDTCNFYSQNPFSQKTSLDILAENCICQCRELLFSLTPIEYFPMGRSGFGGYPDFDLNVREFMERELTGALCRHLIVTFAYRFLCDNLEPKSLMKYCNILYDCKNGIDVSKDKDQIWDEKRNYYKTMLQKYKDFCNDLGIEWSNPEKKKAEKEKAEKEKAEKEKAEKEKAEKKNAKKQEKKGLPEESILTTLKKTAYDVNAAAKYKAILQADLSGMRLAPPSAWFLLLYISAKKDFYNIACEEKDKAVALTKVLSKAECICALVCEKNCEQDQQELVPVRSSAVVEIPIASTAHKYSAIPDITYSFRKDGGDTVISARLQRAFNNYILERNFHLHAIATAECCLRKFGIQERNQRYSTMLMPFQLHAPLVQSSLIFFLDSMQGLWKEPSVVEHYIKRWNRIALPVLEELFIQNVWRNLPAKADVAAEIQKWIEQEANFERMNFIRTIRSEKTISVPVDPISREFHNRIVDSAFRITDNLAHA